VNMRKFARIGENNDNFSKLCLIIWEFKDIIYSSMLSPINCMGFQKNPIMMWFMDEKWTSSRERLSVDIL